MFQILLLLLSFDLESNLGGVLKNWSRNHLLKEDHFELFWAFELFIDRGFGDEDAKLMAIEQSYHSPGLRLCHRRSWLLELVSVSCRRSLYSRCCLRIVSWLVPWCCLRNRQGLCGVSWFRYKILFRRLISLEVAKEVFIFNTQHQDQKVITFIFLPSLKTK